jgi:hypothetical protein
MLKLSFSFDFLHVQLLIVFVNLRILAVVFGTFVPISVCEELILNLVIPLILLNILHFFHSILFFFYSELLIERIKHHSFALFLPHFPVILGFETYFKNVIHFRIHACTSLMINLKEMLIFLLNLLSHHDFPAPLSVLLIFHLLSLASNVIIVSTILLSFHFVNVIFAINLAVQLASKNDWDKYLN